MNPNIAHNINTYHYSTDYIPLDANNAGGFYANPNVAGAFLGINYFIARSLYTINNEKKYLVFCVILAAGVFATGSGGSILIWLVLNFSTVLCLGNKKYYTKIFKWSVCLLLTFCGMIFLIIHHWVFSFSIIDRFMSTVNVRKEMFDFAYSSFHSHWLLGFGFGGWKKELVNCETIYVLDAPHNTLLALWGNSGIVAVIIGIFFIYSILQFGYKLTRVKNIDLNRLGYGVILSFLFYFIQGMGENYGLIGEERMCVVLFIFLGYVYAQKKQQCL
ncbi:MAG: hypothetical protein GY777_07925 [Candidatus Brocadiaceae bacterium]|nr:hypothetical protein [Candidatus Brocadiaceae bacterium]